MQAYFDGIKKEVPAAWGDLFLDPEHTAVITVDMSKGHLYFPEHDYLPQDEPIIPGVNRFLAEVRSLGMPVIHFVMDPQAAAYNQANPMSYGFVWPMSLGDVRLDMPAEAAGEISVDVRDGDFVFKSQTRLSLFLGTSLEILLRNLGIRRVVLVGAMTDCNVLLAAFEASDRDFRVVVARDLCAGTKHLHSKALDIVSLHCALVADSGDLLAYWKK